ncbi:uncharacterized protein GBIM_09229 [Gryllus bimaculatus]|nr:uncharacterized protein GBIM_09229 [Gryllus bimaculatus]
MSLKTLMVLALVGALVQAALAIECAPGICSAVRCANVDPASCNGEVRQHASFCGCCPLCISIIQAGGLCFDGILGLPPTSECATGTACINSTCTPLTEISEQ